MVKFQATVGYWRPEREGGLAIVDVPSRHIASLGGLKQRRVAGKINGSDFQSSVWPAGSGRLALNVSKAMMKAAGIAVGAVAKFEVGLVAPEKQPTRKET